MLFRKSTLPLLLGVSTLADAFVITGLHNRQSALHGQFTLGNTKIPLSTVDGAAFVGDSLRSLCSDFGCDEGTTDTVEYVAQFETYGDMKDCTWSLTASGNYDSTDERDYMINVLTTALTTTADVETITVSIEDNPLCTHQGQPSCTDKDIQVTSAVNFGQVVLNQDDGSNTGQLEYHLSVECVDSSGFDCPSFVSGNLKDILSAVPEVGNIFAQVFDIACA
ncbi:hypothetical protein BDV96DRAFT_636867 [Lophiotrema nucula]|uniref:Uncharacterized protein n=1 Tax=Lophiotrema nucula TaxID=690887 RepID=A0A6A5YQA9_9PLEO|nr:hypothetical protein BDV96DRAFT_636867 [Lophiotrema nucula]